ncbi:MAG: DUF4249 domain-containing protein [Bacteroidales bacterium]|jgi:hypothetical protein|nr:DUF4249 domain-containing protein [Bacteroidales bacterium]
MGKFYIYIILPVVLIISGCITSFVPETDEDPDLLVVEAMITDQAEAFSIRLSRSMPLGERTRPTTSLRPVSGYIVSIVDDLGNYYQVRESSVNGTYVTDPAFFRAVVGRTYTLRINPSFNSEADIYSYQSLPMKMNPVPPIDSLYYGKVLITDKTRYTIAEEGCNVYLNTEDPSGECKFFRWDYSETWKFQLPYPVPNNTCWISSNSDNILIKSTSVLSEARVSNFPVKFISNETDRLKVRYSILVNQYSLNEDEFTFWEKLQNISEEVGGLYDITPGTIPGNIYCVEEPSRQVLGYFSVSAKTSSRLYIDEYFRGVINLYSDCVSDTIFGRAEIPELNSRVWILEEQMYAMPPFRVLTEKKFCADCSVRGTTTRPDFWLEKDEEEDE